METVEELHEALQKLVSMATGIPLSSVILANQAKPAPKHGLVYATYNPLPIRAYGYPRQDYEEIPAIEDAAETGWTDLRQTVVTSLELMLSVNIYNDGGKDAAMRMQNANFLEPIKEHLYRNGIGWRQAGTIRDLTSLQRASYQSRHQLDVDLVVEAENSATLLSAALAIVKIYDEDGNLISGD